MVMRVGGLTEMGGRSKAPFGEGEPGETTVDCLFETHARLVAESFGGGLMGKFPRALLKQRELLCDARSGLYGEAPCVWAWWRLGRGDELFGGPLERSR